ncbi:MAG: leucine-rich repeat domain-containing protein [Clostridia bacterium]|nr:leucine-rich repeat domain-containing protein [Clostridia bacterium]
MDRKDELRHKILLTVALVVLSGLVLVLVLRFRDDTLAQFTYEQADGGIVVKGYSGDPTTLEVPETIDGFTVVAVGENAFAAQTRIEEVILPGTVTEIGAAAFADCASLESVEAPGVTVIRIEAFQGCTELSDVTFSDRLAVVEDRAFQGCSKLSALKAPATLTEIGTDAFAGCGNLHLDVSENRLAAEIALQYGLSTDGSDTSDGMWLRIAGATLLLGAFVAVIWVILSRISKSKRGRDPIPTSHGSGEEK